MPVYSGCLYAWANSSALKVSKEISRSVSLGVAQFSFNDRLSLIGKSSYLYLIINFVVFSFIIYFQSNSVLINEFSQAAEINNQDDQGGSIVMATDSRLFLKMSLYDNIFVMEIELG